MVNACLLQLSVIYWTHMFMKRVEATEVTLERAWTTVTESLDWPRVRTATCPCPPAVDTNDQARRSW